MATSFSESLMWFWEGIMGVSFRAYDANEWIID
jgi:hypothetical protein